MTTDQVYEKELLNKLEELDRTRAWVESELREVRNRMQRQVNREIIEWHEGRPHFSNIGEWVAK